MSIPQKCAAVVVGAGPAGLAIIGNLLERNVGKIAWIDPCFQGGRVNRKYREVPSNTKVALFQAYATAIQPFRTIIENTPSPNPFTTLEKLDQNKTCHLHHAADMTRALTEGVAKTDQVYTYRGMVTAANLAETTSTWTVQIKPHHPPSKLETDENEFSLLTERLILCTGAFPTTNPLPLPSNHKTNTPTKPQPLDLDTVLKPSDLITTLPRNTHPTTVGVIGASHSAILALLNLLDLARSTHPHLHIKWFTRHPLRYAVYMDGWILRDNSGLKGLAADFARSQLEDDVLLSSEAGKYITKIDCGGGPQREEAQFAKHLPECGYVVQAIGFTNEVLPELSRDKVPLGEVRFDHENGGFVDENDRRVKGLFGAGVAFPERVVDPAGNVEFAVGFWKFMRFAQRVVPGWLMID